MFGPGDPGDSDLARADPVTRAGDVDAGLGLDRAELGPAAWDPVALVRGEGGDLQVGDPLRARYVAVQPRDHESYRETVFEGQRLAVHGNGQPLPFEHGFPVRLVVPGLYGYVSGTKWVTDLKVTTFAADQGYWVPRGWSQLGPIKTESRIDGPSSGDRVSAGKVAVAGIAWAEHRGIKAVEVRVDNGPW